MVTATPRVGALAILIAASACIDPLPIQEGGACPCAAEFICCPSTNTCLLECPSPPDAAVDAGVVDATTSPTDAGHPDAAAPDASFDAGFYDGGVVVTVPTPPPSIGPWTWSNNNGTTHRSDGFTTTWSGDELLMFGGQVSGCAPYHDRYNPWTDQWRRFDVGLESRGDHSAHWTGERLLLWGGNVCGLTDDTFANGGYYDPIFHRTTPIADAPGAAAFHASTMFGERLFVYGGGCFAEVCLDRGAIYEPDTNTWRSVATEGAPNPFEGVRNVAWTGNEILLWGGPESSGRYYPSVDAWQPFPEPPFTLGVGAAVWTGTNFIVYDGRTAGRFDPLTNIWTRTSTGGLPVGLIGARAVWTGEEMIVLGQDGGAHYDPDADRWSPVTPNGAYYAPANSRVVWTGREVLVFGSAVPTGTHGARYGPRLGGDPACTGGAPPLTVRINTPTARTVVEGTVDLRAAIVNEFSLQRVAWSFDGVEIANTQTVVHDISATPRGPHVVRAEAEDAMGNITCSSRTLFVDRSPAVVVTAPDNEVVARPTVRAAATCTDDGPEPCTIRVLVDDVVVATSSTAAFDETIDLASFEGRFVTLTFEARDDVGRTTTDTRFVYVESSVRLVPHADVIGTTCDVTPSRALFDDGNGNFLVYDVQSSTTVVYPRTGALDCAASRLVEPNGAFLKAGSQVQDLVDGVVRSTFTAGEMRVADDWVVVSAGLSLERRRPSIGLVEVVGSRPYPAESFDIATNGDVLWGDRDGVLTFSPFGGSSETLASLTAPPPFTSPLVTPTWSVWRQRGTPTTQWSLHVRDINSNRLLTGPHDYAAQGPRRERTYLAAGGFVAYEAPDLQQIAQVWLVDPSGTTSIVTGFTNDTKVVALDDTGDLVYARQGRFFWFDRETGTRTEFGSDLGTVYARAGGWFVQYGRTLYRIAL